LAVEPFESELWLEYHSADVLYELRNRGGPVNFLMESNMEKKLLRNVKIFRLFFVQFLIMGLFANSLLPQACFCG
jgi:hypothetical protein